jgi:hypothetical protein
VKFEDAEELERVVVEERVRARRNLSLSAMVISECVFVFFSIIRLFSRGGEGICRDGFGCGSRLRDLTVLRTSRSSWFACLTEVVVHIRLKEVNWESDYRGIQLKIISCMRRRGYMEEEKQILRGSQGLCSMTTVSAPPRGRTRDFYEATSSAIADDISCEEPSILSVRCNRVIQVFDCIYLLCCAEEFYSRAMYCR